uniref:Uncharacterized protein n=1 Tax=Arcella intermedia TaxID=1963864 RepID=A0A6B2L7D5_9EUKA
MAYRIYQKRLLKSQKISQLKEACLGRVHTLTSDFRRKLFPILDNRLKEYAGIARITAEIRKGEDKETKEKGLQNLKIQVFSMASTMIYASTLLEIYLLAQFTLLNRYFFLDVVHSKRTISQALQERLLETTIPHFLDVGLPILFDKMLRVVSKVMASLPLAAQLSNAALLEHFNTIQLKFIKHEQDGMEHCFEEILLPMERGEPWEYRYTNTVLEEDKIQLLINELRDIIESTSFVGLVDQYRIQCTKDLVLSLFSSAPSLILPTLLPAICKAISALPSPEEGQCEASREKFLRENFDGVLEEEDLVEEERKASVMDMAAGMDMMRMFGTFQGGSDTPNLWPSDLSADLSAFMETQSQ